jgi:hypothetical protein
MKIVVRNPDGSPNIILATEAEMREAGYALREYRGEGAFIPTSTLFGSGAVERVGYRIVGGTG